MTIKNSINNQQYECIVDLKMLDINDRNNTFFSNIFYSMACTQKTLIKNIYLLSSYLYKYHPITIITISLIAYHLFLYQIFDIDIKQKICQCTQKIDACNLLMKKLFLFSIMILGLYSSIECCNTLKNYQIIK